MEEDVGVQATQYLVEFELVVLAGAGRIEIVEDFDQFLVLAVDGFDAGFQLRTPVDSHANDLKI